MIGVSILWKLHLSTGYNFLYEVAHHIFSHLRDEISHQFLIVEDVKLLVQFIELFKILRVHFKATF